MEIKNNVHKKKFQNEWTQASSWPLSAPDDENRPSKRHNFVNLQNTWDKGRILHLSRDEAPTIKTVLCESTRIRMTLGSDQQP